MWILYGLFTYFLVFWAVRKFYKWLEPKVPIERRKSFNDPEPVIYLSGAIAFIVALLLSVYIYR
jgi:hypothetical protein|tara:strand:+ start:173 stop:364 length:192 start_codon:yes stop_codon:yes gene_type:complete